ncbi:MAG: Rne/Rng family ribonuclease [Acidimicrobiales bacterium]
MSDALPDHPGPDDFRPPTPPRPRPAAERPAGTEAPPSSDPQAAPGETEDDTAATGAAHRRRRGSRGGRNRNRSAGTRDTSAGGDEDGDESGGENASPLAIQSPDGTSSRALSAVDHEPPVGNGRPTPRPAAPKPKIGDSRPAPTSAPPPSAQSVGGAGSPGGGQASGGGDARPGAGAGSAGNGGSGGRSARGRAGTGPAGRGRGTPARRRQDPAASSGAASASSGAAGEDRAVDFDSYEDGAPIETATEGRRRRRRGGRGGRGGAERATDEAVEVDAETLERRRGRERKGRPVGRYMMLVHVQPGATQIAVLEGRSLIEHYVSRPADDATQIDGNVYLGRVQNVLPGMEAAFVDIGTPKNAVLYRGDVHYDREDLDSDGGSGAKSSRHRGGPREARIEQLLKVGQTIVCQVTKNPIGTKGARLSQEVSLPGRFVVLIPSSDTYGISKRLADDERKRLRRILDDIRPAGHGLIVRTAAEGASADELRRDVALLLHQWDQIEAKARRSRAPALLYREPDMAVRVIREEFNNDYRGVVIDDKELFAEVRDYVASISPELADRVEYAGDSDSPLPIFERYRVHEQVHKALDRKVWLPSGGSLIIERTEALTVIDVNTGKNVGTSNLEETVFRNNLEAAEEIARQLRLRDIGGIIVIDFIDMEIAANRAEVARAFREALSRDKTRTQVFDISELGLVEMTRKRVSEGLVESFSETCPTCGGRGILLDQELL